MGERWPVRVVMVYDERATPSPAMPETSTAPAPAPTPDQEMLQIAADLIVANEAAKGWENRQKALKARLSELWSVGVAPTTFLHNGYNFTLQDGKEGLEIDDEGKEQIERLKAQLIEEGHAEPKTGAPFWVTRKAANPRARKKGKNPVSAVDIANPAILQQ